MSAKNDMPLCEICLGVMVEGASLEDGVTLTANCCGREGLCAVCREEGQHDCNDPPYAGSDQWALAQIVRLRVRLDSWLEDN